MMKSDMEDKFIALYQKYSDEIYRYVYLRIGTDTTIAEDLTQEIFLAAFRSLSRFRKESSERTWLFQITRHKLNDYYRKKYRSLPNGVAMDAPELENLIDPEQDMQEIQERNFECEKVQRCLLSLNEEYRYLLILKYLDDSSVNEIAQMIGKTPKATGSMLMRAKVAFVKNYDSGEDR